MGCEFQRRRRGSGSSRQWLGQRGPALARHPHAPVPDAAIQPAAKAMLQVEGAERVPRGAHSPAIVAPSEALCQSLGPT